MRRPVKKRTAHITVGSTLTLLFLWFAVPGSSPDEKASALREVVQIISRVDPIWILPLVTLLGLFFWLKAYRWKLILVDSGNIGTYDVVPATMIGFMANNILPAHLGELVRVYVLARTHRLSKTMVFSTVVLERMFDLFALLSFLGLCVLARSTPREVWIGGLLAGSGGLLLLGLLLLYGHKPEFLARGLSGLIRWLPAKTGFRIQEIFLAGSLGLGLLRRSRRSLFVMAVSLLHWFIMVIAIQLTLVAFGLDVPLTASFFILVVTAAGVMIPSAPGYWGIYQACFILALKPFNVPQETALAGSLYFHLINYIPVTVVGLAYMSRLGFRLKELGSSESAGA